MQSIEEFNTIEEFKTFIRSLNNKNPYEMFSIDEAAVAFNLAKKRLTRAMNEKEIPEYKIDGKQRMMRRRDIEKWIDSKLKQELILSRSKDLSILDIKKDTTNQVKQEDILFRSKDFASIESSNNHQSNTISRRVRRQRM